MTDDQSKARALKALEERFPAPPEHKERDWYQRVRSVAPEKAHEGDWSGSSWSGDKTSGRNWSGGREI
jgi:hypothetical protein